MLCPTLELPAVEELQPSKVWSPEKITETKLISDVQLSPDNQMALFVVTEPKMEEDKGSSLSRIYKAKIGNEENCQLFFSHEYSCGQPRWSPDGKWVAFLSHRDGISNLYLISSEGGEAIALTAEKKSVQTFAWSPDGQKIAFVKAVESEPNRTKTSLAYVYKQNEDVNRLWLIDVFSAHPVPKALTSNEYCVRGSGDFGTINCEFDWSPDSNAIVFAHSPSIGFDDFHLDSSIATVNLLTGTITPWSKQAPYEASPRYSPNGQLVAYLSGDSSKRYAVNRRVAIRSQEGQLMQLLAPTFNEGIFLAGPNILGWTQDGQHVLFFEPKHTKYHVAVVPINGSPAHEILAGDCFFKDPALSPDRTHLGFISQSPMSSPEAYISSLSNFAPKQISALNDSSAAEIKTEVVTWQSKDGLDIEGLLTYPRDYTKGQAYPLLVVIHGGPMGFFDETFIGTPNAYPIASFAENGFVVFRPNPRGSCGYGKKFRCANYGDWGGDDFLDIMTGVDALIAKGIADPQRMGVMGWSYGGYMSAWIVSQTSRFKAASLGAGPYNLVSLAGTTDLHRLLPDYLGDFFDQPELYKNRSPLTFVSRITTPCLIQHGTDDKRVPASQAYELYHALERLGNKPVLILYPGMGHRLSDPKMQLDAMRSNLEWFQKYL
jgi:dipeptidyl aminopeptidase/acylaminoacyl peptidase